MRYLRAYQVFFATPNWPLNLLAGAICQAVPVVGPMVYTGFILSLLDKGEPPDEQPVPAFDRDRVGEYLWRGLWPVIVQIIAILPVLLIAWIVGMVLVAVIAGEPPKPAVGARVSLAVLLPLVLAGVATLSVPLVPVTLYVGLRQEVSDKMTPFVLDFFRRVGREALLAQLFIATSGTGMVLFGILFMCVPLFPALAVVQFAQYQLAGQLYRLYLERGGSDLSADAPPLTVGASAPENP